MVNIDGLTEIQSKEINKVFVAINNFKIMITKRADVFYTEAQLQSEMGNYDKAYAFKIRSDEARTIYVDLCGYLKQFDDITNVFSFKE